MQLSCFRSVAQSAKQLPSDWEEPAPEVATSNRRHTGSTQKVQCTECTYRECTVHRARATRVEKAGPWSGDTATCGADPRYDARVPQCSDAGATLVHQLAKLRGIRWPCLVRYRFLAKRLLYPKTLNMGQMRVLQSDFNFFASNCYRKARIALKININRRYNSKLTFSITSKVTH